MSNTDADEPDDAPFPPLWVTRLCAYGLSTLTMPLLWGWRGGENRDAVEDRLFLTGWLFVASLIPGWLAYIWTQQEHFDHATAAFVLSIALVVASLLVAYA